MDNVLHSVLQESQDRGFIGPGSLFPHIEHARSFNRLIPDDAHRCADLGSGGGLPGLVLAFEDSRAWTLIDGMEKRCEFLSAAVQTLGIEDRVQVLCGRAEEVGRDVSRETFDVVVARSFGAPAVLAECASPLVRVGGLVIVAEPPEDGLRWPEEELTALGLVVDRAIEDPKMIALAKVSPVDARYPRRVGVPNKRPLWS